MKSQRQEMERQADRSIGRALDRLDDLARVDEVTAWAMATALCVAVADRLGEGAAVAMLLGLDVEMVACSDQH